MDVCKQLASDKFEEGTVVIANYQNSGRGRFNRVWISPAGINLHVSILLSPTFDQMKYLNMAATLAVIDTIKKITNIPSQIKWPNDVQVNGKKISGILIESELSTTNINYSVVGIGLNINLNPQEFPEISNFATSLKNETKLFINRSTVLHTLIKFFDHYYNIIKQNKSLTKKWGDYLNTIGRNIEISFTDKPGEQTISGLAHSVNEDGSLNLKLDDNSLLTVSAGEITINKIEWNYIKSLPASHWIKFIPIIATRGAKSNIPVLGSLFLIGDNIGSVVVYNIVKIVKTKLPGTINLPGTQEERTLANINKYSIQVNMEMKLYKSKINLTPKIFHKQQLPR